MPKGSQRRSVAPRVFIYRSSRRDPSLTAGNYTLQRPRQRAMAGGTLPGMKAKRFETLVESDRAVVDAQTAGAAPSGRLPLTAEMLLERPSGDVFGLTQNAGMGWDPRELGRPQFLMLGTNGGIRAPDGRPIALGYHTGHWEIGLLMQAAAEEFRAQECLPF